MKARTHKELAQIGCLCTSVIDGKLMDSNSNIQVSGAKGNLCKRPQAKNVTTALWHKLGG
jgi:hypothetical protein